jgi:hypothetical protein
MNEVAETGLPFDFRLTFQSGASSGTDEEEDNTSSENVKFIEVKSTIKDSKEAFPVSIQELLFAQKFATQFEIYRVYNAANADMSLASLRVIKEVPHLLNSHGIDLFIVI